MILALAISALVGIVLFVHLTVAGAVYDIGVARALRTCEFRNVPDVERRCHGSSPCHHEDLWKGLAALGILWLPLGVVALLAQSSVRLGSHATDLGRHIARHWIRPQTELQ